ncbi:DUF7666 domain-containing protein [Chitinophaga pinensis]|uniref:Pentapeptide repeat containing protein n=1 Tax=Chitinophaga pinensis (strain ATCC 43595 / DSM 2588 / LMG 13176 / NBRC 15968 / NCIMB 11800 / UQM 2034) TaxID=485918 RepID=A0A979G650_CHIPD|nr:pentapeptide repeat-containing protein [Chitinophaga pinensis]ACU61322.1 pentapeptide repeat containing protein [Chitinophaga pinensis DSM 2588]
MEKEIIKGYKVTDNDMRCRGYQYELGKTYNQPGQVELCGNGFHFCVSPAHCFNYYEFTSDNRVFEIEASGDIVHGNDKSACSDITLVRELTWEEVLKFVNQGVGNTGFGNTGDWNTGDRNTGYRNTGDWNTGDRNTGYRNTGDWNTGYRNTGYRNTGDWNTGDRNTGYSNTGYRNTGAFCTGEAPFPIFNQPSNWTEHQFKQSKAYSLLCQVDTKQWVPSSHMSDAEKEKYPSHKTAEGYLKDIPFKEAFQNKWHNWSAESRRAFFDLPNFSWEIFTEITGVKPE